MAPGEVVDLPIIRLVGILGDVDIVDDLVYLGGVGSLVVDMDVNH